MVVETSHVTPGLSPVQQQHIEHFQVKASSLLQPQASSDLQSDLHSSSCPAGGDSSVGIKRESETPDFQSCFSVCSSFFTFSGDFSSVDEVSGHRSKCLSTARERLRLLLRLCALQPVCSRIRGTRPYPQRRRLLYSKCWGNVAPSTNCKPTPYF